MIFESWSKQINQSFDSTSNYQSNTKNFWILFDTKIIRPSFKAPLDDRQVSGECTIGIFIFCCDHLHVKAAFWALYCCSCSGPLIYFELFQDCFVFPCVELFINYLSFWRCLGTFKMTSRKWGTSLVNGPLPGKVVLEKRPILEQLKCDQLKTASICRSPNPKFWSLCQQLQSRTIRYPVPLQHIEPSQCDQKLHGKVSRVRANLVWACSLAFEPELPEIRYLKI